MPDLPAPFAALIITFAPLFVGRSWVRAPVLLVGAILAPGRRTVASVLRITGHARDRHFTNDHRVLSRAPWSARNGAWVLLGHLVRAFAPRGPVVVGLDDTIERRWGQRIGARGIDRDQVRSSHSHFVKTSGLRWISLMLLAPVPRAGRIWALPFLTALVPSERYSPAGPPAPIRQGGRLVAQNAADLLRRPRGRPPRGLARTALPGVTTSNRPPEIPFGLPQAWAYALCNAA